MHLNHNNQMDENDRYFLCPLLGPDREEPGVSISRDHRGRTMDKEKLPFTMAQLHGERSTCCFSALNVAMRHPCRSGNRTSSSVDISPVLACFKLLLNVHTS